jgi:hypothetical protein
MAQSTTNRDQIDPESEGTTGSSPELVAQDASDGPPSPDWPSIDDHEELIWEDSPGFKYFLSDLVLGILIVGIGATLALIGGLQLFDVLPATVQLVLVAFGGLTMALGIVFLAINYRSYQRKQYALTTEAIYRRWDGSTTGIETENVSKIQYEQSSCGDLTIGWFDDEKNEIVYPAVPHPDQVRNRLTKPDGRDN